MVSHLIMIVGALMAVLPMILLLTSSLTDNNMLIANGYTFLPKKLTFDNYTYIFTNSNKVLRAYGVSALLTVCGTSLGIAITLLIGYGLSRPGLPGRGFLVIFVVITMLFNGGLVPTYINYTNVFHVKNTFWGLLIPSLVTNGFYVMLVKSYFTTSVPNEILEAAEIDGTGEVGKFFWISAPMALPILATVGLFIGIGYWNDWNNGYIYISTNTDLYSIQNLLNRMQLNLEFLMQNAQNINADAGVVPTEGIRMAIALLGVLPVLIVYPFIQKFFVKGITLGGVKG